jgi:ABC-2 type transport system permease protein
VRRAFDLRGFGAVLYKEWIHILHDPTTFALSLGLPMIQLMIFGYAINTRVEHIATAFVDEDRSAASQRLIDALRASQAFDLVERLDDREKLAGEIVAGRVKVAFDIPPGFAAHLRLGRQVAVLALIDGSDGTVAQQAYSTALALGPALEGGRGAGIEIRPRVLFNPSMRSANFMIPGLIGVIMQNITIFLTALSIVGERERGTLDQLLVTPIGTTGLMLGKIVPYAILGLVDFALVVGLMTWLFAVPIAGNLGLLFLLGGGFMTVALGMGLMISTIARTQNQAILMGSAVLLPSIMLSGFFFERELMPPVMQFVGDLIPLTYFIEILRGVILRGAGLRELAAPASIMLALGLVLLGVASVRFARTASA